MSPILKEGLRRLLDEENIKEKDLSKKGKHLADSTRATYEKVSGEPLQSADMKPFQELGQREAAGYLARCPPV
ncbi:hypothetical protein HMJ29_04955 [Hymenobacter taeanensis]|uniref:Uncharacterized protein n=1 Tax=Hymenobacter taeanensis TaxID=2735321 RepID=A0A6M6BEB1_9BACT|nr:MULTISPECIES: hypothetical protein [Hymenobacter]QJX46319.1 hypothetical protein HMJ29_04955 [Hymenobacter taeanensis]UOQ80177.1 hypothetical protein MUN83_15245 [Hymenobacter sp. 5414T-23]